MPWSATPPWHANSALASRKQRRGGRQPRQCTCPTTTTSASTRRRKASPRYGEFDFASISPDCYPLLLHVPYFDLYRKQVVKQADLVLAMHWRGDAFTLAQKARNFAYYEQRTVRDSSLSACTQAVIAAEVGHLGLAYDYLGEAALMDLQDLEHNTRDGVHIASLASTWTALVAGFRGLRHQRGNLSLAPRLPDDITRLAICIMIRGRNLS